MFDTNTLLNIGFYATLVFWTVVGLVFFVGWVKAKRDEKRRAMIFRAYRQTKTY